MHASLIAPMRIIFPAHLKLLHLTVVIKSDDTYGTNYNSLFFFETVWYVKVTWHGGDKVSHLRYTCNKTTKSTL